MDNEITYSWCFNCVECFDSTSSAAIIILIKKLESFSSLKSQHLWGKLRIYNAWVLDLHAHSMFIHFIMPFMSYSTLYSCTVIWAMVLLDRYQEI